MISGLGGAGFSPVQLMGKMTERFERADVNQDGAVSRGEMSAAMEANGRDSSFADRIFGRMDADGDGLITQQEQQAGMQAMIEKMSSIFSRTDGEQSFDAIQALLDQLSSSERDDDTKNRLEEIRERVASEGLPGRTLSDLASIAYPRLSGIDVRV
jgi:Ca2+-binding EF-hand superfamily protein